MCLGRVGCQLPSVHHHHVGSGGGGAEKRNTTHTHASISIHQTRGRRPEFRVGVVVVASTLYMHGRASKGSMGLEGGLLQRPDMAAICIDCDQQTCASTVRTATKDDDDDSNVAQRMLLHCLDVICCMWRFTCDIEDSILPRKELRKQASTQARPTLATLLGPRYVHESKVEASGWQRHRTVAPRLQFSRHK